MPILEDVLIEEYERSLRIIDAITRENASLARGGICKENNQSIKELKNNLLRIRKALGKGLINERVQA